MRARNHPSLWLTAASILALAGCQSTEPSGASSASGPSAASGSALTGNSRDAGPKKESTGSSNVALKDAAANQFDNHPNEKGLKNGQIQPNSVAGNKKPGKSAEQLKREKAIAAEASQPFTPARLAADMEALAKAIEAEKSFKSDKPSPLAASDREQARQLRTNVEAAREKVSRTLGAPGGPNNRTGTSASAVAAKSPNQANAGRQASKANTPAEKSDTLLTADQKIQAQKTALAKAVEAEKAFNQDLRTRLVANGNQELTGALSAEDTARQRKLRDSVDDARRQLAQMLPSGDSKSPHQDGAPRALSGLAVSGQPAVADVGNLTAALPDVGDPKAPASARSPLAFRLSDWLTDEKAHQAWREKHLAKINDAQAAREKAEAAALAPAESAKK
jgi:hypothetical protein